MGFATSITVIIFFMAFLLLGSMTYPAIFQSFNSIKDSIEDNHEIQKDALNTRISIISTISSGGIISITISNNGSTVIHAGKSNVLLDGNYTTYDVMPPGLWVPGKDAVFTINADTGVSHRIKIITENGISAYTEV